MDRSYQFNISDSDPEITLALPVGMVNDLCAHAEANGNQFSIEMMLRLARTLERDQYRDEVDNMLSKVFPAPLSTTSDARY